MAHPSHRKLARCGDERAGAPYLQRSPLAVVNKANLRRLRHKLAKSMTRSLRRLKPL
jgi:hypothetical protein